MDLREVDIQEEEDHQEEEDLNLKDVHQQTHNVHCAEQMVTVFQILHRFQMQNLSISLTKILKNSKDMVLLMDMVN